MAIEEIKMICLGCPVGCSLLVTREGPTVLKVEGNQCDIGVQFAKSEIEDLRRKVTTTVRIEGGILPLLPVYTDALFPKDKILELVEVLRNVGVKAPVNMDDIILENALNTGVNIRASRSIRRKE